MHGAVLARPLLLCGYLSLRAAAVRVAKALEVVKMNVH